MLTTLLLALIAASDTLSAAERSVVSHVDAHRREAIGLLERIVNLNSGTLNLPGVRQVGDVLRSEFEALGFTTRWIDGAPFKRAGHLVAEHPGRGPRMLLIGHLDTVFEPDSPFQKVEWIDSVTARGCSRYTSAEPEISILAGWSISARALSSWCVPSTLTSV